MRADAVLPPAPGRGSTITGWPRRGLSPSATIRVIMSPLPPAAKPMVSVTERFGSSPAQRRDDSRARAVPRHANVQFVTAWPSSLIVLGLVLSSIARSRTAAKRPRRVGRAGSGIESNRSAERSRVNPPACTRTARGGACRRAGRRSACCAVRPPPRRSPCRGRRPRRKPGRCGRRSGRCDVRAVDHETAERRIVAAELNRRGALAIADAVEAGLSPRGVGGQGGCEQQDAAQCDRQTGNAPVLTPHAAILRPMASPPSTCPRRSRSCPS